MGLKIFSTTVSQDWVNNIPGARDSSGSFDVGMVLGWVYAAIGLVAVIYLIYSAVAYLMSQGDPGKIKQASQSIVCAVIGLVIVLLAAAITYFVMGALGATQ